MKKLGKGISPEMEALFARVTKKLEGRTDPVRFRCSGGADGCEDTGYVTRPYSRTESWTDTSDGRERTVTHAKPGYTMAVPCPCCDAGRSIANRGKVDNAKSEIKKSVSRKVKRERDEGVKVWMDRYADGKCSSTEASKMIGAIESGKYDNSEEEQPMPVRPAAGPVRIAAGPVQSSLIPREDDIPF